MSKNLKKFILDDFISNEETPVVTRDGLSAEILKTTINCCYPIAVLIDNRFILLMNKNGDCYNTSCDLFFEQIKWNPAEEEECFAPDIMKKELYISFYYDSNHGFDKALKDRHLIFKTKEEAIKASEIMLKALEDATSQELL